MKNLLKLPTIIRCPHCRTSNTVSAVRFLIQDDGLIVPRWRSYICPTCARFAVPGQLLPFYTERQAERRVNGRVAKTTKKEVVLIG